MVEQNKYPATIGRSGSCAVDDYADADAVLGRIGKYEDMWNYYMEIDALQKQTSLSLQAGYTQSNLNHRTSFNMTYMPQIEDHVNITYGTSLEDAKTEMVCILVSSHRETLTNTALSLERYSA